MLDLNGFKAYDIRGKYPVTLNEELAKNIGYAYAKEFSPKSVVIGYDARLSGPNLYHALADGLRAAGVDVTGIGMCGTEEIYYASFAKGFEGGIMVTGSHNPADENGFKMVRGGAVPVSGDSGLFAIRDRIANGQEIPEQLVGSFTEASFRDDYVEHLLSYVDQSKLKKLKIVADPGNGCAGLVLEKLTKKLPFDFTIINAQPDGHFPNGVPNPLLPTSRDITAKAVKENKADIGLAWDGDFDRCFFYDSEGNFIEGYYLVGMIAESLLQLKPGSKIIHDPRLTWNTQEVVKNAGGTPIESKTGHAFIKERMRKEDALYGGEMSAHHYFRDFAYCDSGMISWLLVAQLLCTSGKSLAEFVESRIKAYPCSGEINSKVADIKSIVAHVEDLYGKLPGATVKHIDGLSVEFNDWRFNLRGSNTEPILRLNVESKNNQQLMEEKTEELLAIIRK